jgi:hypothetical protein
MAASSSLLSNNLLAIAIMLSATSGKNFYPVEIITYKGSAKCVLLDLAGYSYSSWD